jgi:hypothetical protein
VGVEGDGVSPVELHQQGLGDEGMDGLGGVGIPRRDIPPMVKPAEVARRYLEGILNAVVTRTTSGCGVDER